MPSYAKRLKTHLVLHLVDNILDFGPTQCYNTERYESYNSLVRAQNIFGNRQSPSRDIATNFAVQQHLTFICSRGYFEGKQCGEQLYSIYLSTQVQQFLRGVSIKKTQSDKDIYQPGCLRKLHHGTVPCKILDIICDQISLRELLRTCTLHNMPDDVTLEMNILPYSAVMSKTMQLLDVGDFVKISSSIVTTGVLIACGRLIDHNGESSSDVCMIRELQTQYNSDGTVSLTEFDCPILILTNNVFFIATSYLHSPISVAHICSSSCSFSSDYFTYRHDFSNYLFCYNIYCMNNS
ncbi:PREDICTED: uncharacterized protein LOC109587945 [Amphimedon queenslandica]|uniref:Uncharacterized protein n=2 Tax=Amphimedon queenslandica TaxID=400682 RepID=A0AAN0JRT7_AMPQE|nr:PREDICTED: uncharacterized protein LOC109587945 [Amphimedon queenslandica]|eukprot:XP_019859712.1 PREDICTED: uncharacterized protein LOC109587945 [Amphimedon queenslandica]